MYARTDSNGNTTLSIVIVELQNVVQLTSQDELFLMVGKMIALSILHGGPGPVFFARCVIDYMFGGIANVSACIQDIPHLQIQSLIQRVCTCACNL